MIMKLHMEDQFPILKKTNSVTKNIRGALAEVHY